MTKLIPLLALLASFPSPARAGVSIGTFTGFVVNTAQGQGGGYCFGEGLCSSYIGTQAHGFASTIVKDGPDSIRVLTTELDQGSAKRFFREKLQRVK